jgi:MoxR-like ATPase
MSKQLQDNIDIFRANFNALQREVERVIIGKHSIVGDALCALCAGGHVLLEGLPGVGKTLLVKSIAKAFGLSFKRIQFTPDLMPSDITGTQVLSEGANGQRQFLFKPGPLFANVVLADEINRATPKTQSALLEAMGEGQVSVLGETYKLEQPFFVLATQNPVELEGTYPLPEAQLDRFAMKLLLEAPQAQDLIKILDNTTGVDVPEARCVITGNPATAIAKMQSLVREVLVAETIKERLVKIILNLTPQSSEASKEAVEYLRFGPGPRAAQAILLSAKVKALVDGRINVDESDLKSCLLQCLRHRILLNFNAESEGLTADELISKVARLK